LSDLKDDTLSKLHRI